MSIDDSPQTTTATASPAGSGVVGTSATPSAPAAEGGAPTFSVVIPTYRRDPLLSVAIASVLAQTVSPLEVLVVDDAASDDTRCLVESFHDPRLRYHVNDHGRGGAGTRNAGIDRARGTWVAFLDDDDAWLPGRLEQVRARILAGPADLGMVYTGHVKFDFEQERDLEAFRPTVRGWALDRVLYENCVGGLSNVVVRRDVLTAIGGLDERFPALQDMELYVRIAERARFEVVPEPLTRVRRGQEARISFDAAKKLAGGRLFEAKYARLLQRSPRLRHRTASRNFAFALTANDARAAARYAPWTLLGLVFDPSNSGFVARTIGRHLRGRLRSSGTTPAPRTE